MQGSIIRVLVVDGNTPDRKGIVYLLSTVDGMELAGEADDFDSASQLYELTCPDVVIMNLHGSPAHNVDAITAFLDRYPDCKIIATSAHHKDIVLVQQALKAGVRGFIYKSASLDDIKVIIEKVHNDEIALGPLATENLVVYKTHSIQNTIPIDKREYEILVHLSKGAGNDEIATALNITTSSVKTCIRRIFAKLGASNRTEAVAIAYRKGILSNTPTQMD